ncbi:hypothetical protein Tco_0810892 [Tanacetum coccineum]
MSHSKFDALVVDKTFATSRLCTDFKDPSALYLCLYNHIERTMLTFGGRGTSTQGVARWWGGGGGGGGVVGGVGVVCGDGVDRGVGGVDCGVVCGFVCGVVCGGVC